jgi:hypothetical protein
VKVFSCQSCDQMLFFESVQCTRCGHALAFLPDRWLVSAMEPVLEGSRAGGPERWRALASGAQRAVYRMCRNYTEHAVCNWAIPEDDVDDYCRACRPNGIIPNLGASGAVEAWGRLEGAKHRLVYSLLSLGLPFETRVENPEVGLRFEFLSDESDAPEGKVFTGHNNGIITINVAEADAPFREKMRVRLGEAYRTLLGHFRHEIGHYYWDRLIRDGDRLWPFRDLFGDESIDYDSAVDAHYASGPPPDWQDHFVSQYASMHPWEDWAETWAHYLHMVDTLETARAYGLTLQPRAAADRSTTVKPSTISKPRVAARHLDLHSFEDLINGWLPVTTALNSLNRSMGFPDLYPFVLPRAAIEKLRFVHEVIEAASGTDAAGPHRD